VHSISDMRTYLLRASIIALDHAIFVIMVHLRVRARWYIIGVRSQYEVKPSCHPIHPDVTQDKLYLGLHGV
jgi:hypothetical protein